MERLFLNVKSNGKYVWIQTYLMYANSTFNLTGTNLNSILVLISLNYISNLVLPIIS